MAALNKRFITPSRYRVGAVVESDDGRTFAISSINTKARQVVLSGQCGEVYVYLDDEFRNKVASNELKLLVTTKDQDGGDQVVEPRELSPTEIKARDARKAYIDIVTRNIDTSSWDEIYLKIKKELGDQQRVPSRRTVERHWRQYKSAYSLNCLAPHYAMRGVHRSLSMDPVVVEIILTVIEARYCSSSRSSIQDIVNEINRRCDAKSAELEIDLGGVSRRTVGRFIERLNLQKIKGRLSRNSFRLVMRNAVSYHDVQEPYARVEIDATTLDILLVDKDGYVIGCPTLYAMIDTASMTIVGIHLTIQPPSQICVMQTLQFAFSPKGEEFRQKHGCKNDWPAPADIRTLVMDNGSDFHGPMLVNASKHLSMMLEYCMAGAPYQKPFIERFFGTLTTMLIMKLPGAKASHDKREQHALETAQKTAKLTLDELNDFIIRWITDVYHTRKSDRLSDKFGAECTPLKALNILSQKYVVFPAPSPQDLFEACRHTLEIKLKVSREGINYQRQQYQSEYVSSLYKTNRKVAVMVCINPLDCSSIHIYDESSKCWVTVPHKNPNMPAISFEQAKIYRQQSYKSDLDISREADVLNQTQIIEEANAKKSRNGRIRANQKAEREIQKAEAALSFSTHQQVQEVPQLSFATPHHAVKPHRRKK